MRNETGPTAPLTITECIILVLSCLLVIAGCNTSKPAGNSGTAAPAAAPSPPATDFQAKHQQAEQQLHPEIEAQRQQEENEARQALDQEAIAAIAQTEAAIKSIAGNKKDDAVASIERATGKIDILLARNPASALVPVNSEVVVIDTAPLDPTATDQIIQRATDAMKQRDFPAVRILLATLVSEVRIRITSLPLATYPGALQKAAALLDQGKNDDAGQVLLTALNTLVIADHVIPIPLILAQAAITAAESQRQNKDVALTLLQTAKNETNRSRQLGYLSGDAEYKSLNDEIAGLEKAIKGSGDTSSMFSQLRDRLSAFLRRQKEIGRANTTS